jgi:actin-related protein
MDILIDVGAFESLIGIASEENYRFREKSVYSDSNNPIIKKSIMQGTLSDINTTRYYGNAAMRFKNVLNVHFFMKEKDFTSYSKLIGKKLQELSIKLEETGLVLIVSNQYTINDKKNLRNALFQTLKISRIAFLTHTASILKELELSTGVIIDIGYYSTRIESIYKGFPNLDSQFIFPLGGYHVTQQLLNKIFSRLEYKSDLPLLWESERIKKEALLAVENLEKHSDQIHKGFKNFDYLVELPDGNEIIINHERYEPVEIFFNPLIAHTRSDNLIELIEKSIKSWERDQVRELCSNIIIIGNGGNIPGLNQKIEKLLKKQFAESVDVKILEISEQKEIFWKGASKFIKSNKELKWISNPFQEI